jgi:hypothetical protein
MLMIFISFCINGVILSVVLYLFYPLVAPRLFDLHHGFFYTKPLSSYIYVDLWDSLQLNITPIENIKAIQIIRIETYKKEKLVFFDQLNLVLVSGGRIALMKRKNIPQARTLGDANQLATRLNIPLWNVGTVTM